MAFHLFRLAAMACLGVYGISVYPGVFLLSSAGHGVCEPNESACHTAWRRMGTTANAWYDTRMT